MEVMSADTVFMEVVPRSSIGSIKLFVLYCIVYNHFIGFMGMIFIFQMLQRLYVPL